MMPSLEKALRAPSKQLGRTGFARLHFGCSKLVFAILSASANWSATDSAVAHEVRNLLSNLAQSGGSGISVKQGMEILTRARRQTDFDLVKAQALLEQTQKQLAEAREQINEAARLEIQRYQLSMELETLTEQRRQLKALAAKAQGQVALAKLNRLHQLQKDQDSLQKELAELGDAIMDPSQQEALRQAQAKLEKVQEIHDLHIKALEEIVQQKQYHEKILEELAPYAEHNQDTLIEMSSAWQMQAKGQQVIDEIQAELDRLGAEIREVTTELSKLPYFRLTPLSRHRFACHGYQHGSSGFRGTGTGVRTATACGQLRQDPALVPHLYFASGGGSGSMAGTAVGAGSHSRPWRPAFSQ